MDDTKLITRVFLLVVVIAAFTAHAGAWYSSDWDYRKEFTINNTGSELTNYQVMFTVNRSSGTDSGSTVYLNSKCEADYDDIRFVGADDTTAWDYWIESSSSMVASIWVNFTSLPTGDTDVYLYYGNAAAAAVSDGDATFPFFDDFPGSAIDTDKWTVTGTSPTVSGGIGSYTGGLSESYILCKTGFSTNYAIRFKSKSDKDDGVNIFGLRDGPPATSTNLAYISARHDAGFWRAESKVSTYEQTNIGDHDGDYKIWDIIRNGSTSVIFKDAESTVATHTTKVPTATLYPSLYSNKGTDTAVYLYFDWILTRKYTATEPTVSAWGSEEARSTVAAFSANVTTGNAPLHVGFTDASTGVGLSNWTWDFQNDDTPDSYDQNPAFTYTIAGVYTVNLTVTGTGGTDSEIKVDYITVTNATPTPTPTPTGTGGAVTEGNVTYILAPDQDYVPFPIWLAIVIVSVALFGHSIIFLRNSDITAMMATVFAFVSAWLSNMIGYIDVQITSYAEEIVISPVIQAVHPPWLVYTMLIFVFVSVVNIFAAIYKVYIKPVPWNEIYDRKLPKWERRK